MFDISRSPGTLSMKITKYLWVVIHKRTKVRPFSGFLSHKNRTVRWREENAPKIFDSAHRKLLISPTQTSTHLNKIPVSFTYILHRSSKSYRPCRIEGKRWNELSRVSCGSATVFDSHRHFKGFAFLDGCISDDLYIELIIFCILITLQ